MELDHADAEVEDALDLAADVAFVAGLNGADGGRRSRCDRVKAAIQSLTSRVKPMTSGET
jgi:hypothetical protein